MGTKKIMFCDTETHSLYGEVCLFQYVGLKGKPRVKEYPTVEWMKKFIKKHHTVWYNAPYDLGTINHKIELGLNYTFDDLFFATKSAYPELKSYTLDTIHDYLGMNFYDKTLDKKKMQKSFTTAVAKKTRKATPEQIAYAKADVLTLRKLYKYKRIQDILKHNRSYAVDIESLKYALVYQRNGIPVDREALAKERASLASSINENEKLLNGLNPRSPKQCCEALQATATSKEILIELINGKDKERAKLAKLIYDQRRLLKADKMLETWDYDRVHTFFNPNGTVTGRYSCSGGDVGNGYVNTQQITRKYQYLFHSTDPNKVVFEVDYSTAELRAGCSIMNDKTMYAELMAYKDLHIESARLTGIKNPTKADRQKGKAVSFGLIFSMSASAFKEYAYTEFGVSFTLEEAEFIHRAYHNKYKGISRYQDMCWREYQTKVFETAFGHRNIAQLGTDASNFATQGSIAEATKWSIIVLARKHKMKFLKRLINVVHDAIYLEVSLKEFPKWEKRVHKAMLLGWKEICKSDIFHFKDIPMPLETEIIGGKDEEKKVIH